jgi:hypothetical protein
MAALQSLVHLLQESPVHMVGALMNEF